MLNTHLEQSIRQAGCSERIDIGVESLPCTLGNYRLTGILGVGGMATVYEAYRAGSLGIETRVALKVLHPHLAQDPMYLRMFVREAELTSGLNHPNILQVQDFKAEDGLYYMAMEYVDGCDLSRLLESLRQRGDRLPLNLVVDILCQLLRGLAWAHQASSSSGTALELVHRDLKPANILISTAGIVKIGDFGVAKSKADTLKSAASEDIKGTLIYMSPEQLNIEPLTAQSDLFSVGLMLFEMLTGQPAIQERSLSAVIHNITSLDVSRLTGRLPGALESFHLVLSMALQLQSVQRYGSAEEMEDDLHALRAQLPPGPSLARFLRPKWAKLRAVPDYATLPTQVGDMDPGRVFSADDFRRFPVALFDTGSLPESARRPNVPPLQAARIAREMAEFDKEQAALASSVGSVNFDEDDLIFEEEVVLPLGETAFIDLEEPLPRSRIEEREDPNPADVEVPEPRALFGDSVEALWFEGRVEQDLFGSICDVSTVSELLSETFDLDKMSDASSVKKSGVSPVAQREDVNFEGFEGFEEFDDFEALEEDEAFSQWFEEGPNSGQRGRLGAHLTRIGLCFGGLLILLLVL